MPKLVDSMLKVFKRDKDREKSKRYRKSQMDADSFVFVPGDGGGQFWGEVLNNDNFPAPGSQLENGGSRRNTLMGGIMQSDGSGSQDVSIIFRSNAAQKEQQSLMNGKLFNRRLSGTLVKARKSTDEVEDGPLIRDYAFLLSNRERMSGDVSDRYVYDRLIRSPLRRQDSNPPPSVPAPAPPGHWNYSSREKRKSSPLFNLQTQSNQERVHPQTAGRSGPRTSTPTATTGSGGGRDSSLRVDQGYYTSSTRDDKNKRRSREIRQKTTTPRQSHGYSDLEPASCSIAGSEYALPPDALNWDTHSKGMFWGG